MTWFWLTILGLAPITPSAGEADTAIAFVESVGGQISRNSAGQPTAVDLHNAWITDSDLGKLTHLPNLENINLSYTKITDLGLEQLAPLKNVKVLNLRYAEYVTDAGISHLKQWRNLEHLNVHGTKVTSTVFEHVSTLTNLRFLDVAHTRVSDELIEELADLDQLESFSFGGNKMSGVAFPLLKLFPALRRLNIGTQQRTDSGLWSVAVTDFNIDSIAQLEQLEVLELSDTIISDRGVAKLVNLKNLHTLDLSHSRVTQLGIATLAELPNLRRLDLSRAEGINDDAIPQLHELKQLEVLNLTQSNVTGAGLRKLAAHDGLRRLFIGDVESTEEQISSLRQAMPNCEISWWQSPETDPSEETSAR